MTTDTIFESTDGPVPDLSEKDKRIKTFKEQVVNGHKPIKESVMILTEAAGLQLLKSKDYQNPNSSVRQAMHYRRGIDTIHDMIHQKLLRATSLLESRNEAVNEPLEDTYIDMINYCSFAVAWLRGEIEGQDTNLNMFNEKKKNAPPKKM